MILFGSCSKELCMLDSCRNENSRGTNNQRREIELVTEGKLCISICFYLLAYKQLSMVVTLESIGIYIQLQLKTNVVT